MSNLTKIEPTNVWQPITNFDDIVEGNSYVFKNEGVGSCLIFDGDNPNDDDAFTIEFGHGFCWDGTGDIPQIKNKYDNLKSILKVKEV
jgi:hypothetical protein